MNDDDAPRPLWRRLILNRFVMTPLVLASIAGGWALYASTHDDGIVVGRVVDEKGQPTPGATVTLWTFNFTTFRETATTTAGDDGRFAFANNASHNIQVSAEKAGVGRSPRVPIRLYFRAQNTSLAEPLRLSGGA